MNAALTDVRDRVTGVVPERVRAPVVGTVWWVFAALVFYGFVELLWSPAPGTWFQGASVGALYGLIGVGIILIYRTNRIVNFAAAGLGAVPGITCALLIYQKGLSWWIAFPLALAWGAAMGALVDVAIIRRFANSPRLILTVATIGVSQILAYFGVMLPTWLGNETTLVSLRTPFTPTEFQIGNQTFTGDYLFGLAAIAVAVAGLAAFLRFTRIGIALRASAENADRAALLGIPVKRVQTVAWTLAGFLAALAIFVRSGLVGVPADGSLGPKVLLFALAAAVVARFERMGTCLAAGIAIGAMGQASTVSTGKDSFVAGVMIVVVLLALLTQRRQMARAFDSGISTWQSVREFRPIPQELARIREVVAAKAVVAAIGAGLLLAFPYLVGPSRIGYANMIVITAIVAVSLVVLSGWAGQISLGQFGLVGVGAVTAGKLAATWNLDFFVVLLAGVAAGAVAAVLIGIPALRLPGLFLAVATLAFTAAMEYVVLVRGYRIGELIMPERNVRIETPVLWGRIRLTDEFGASRPYYYLCLAMLALCLLVARSYRRTRAGRAVLAIRENPRAASSYSINPARTKLAAFALSGGMAALAGVLLAYQSGAVDASTYGIHNSLTVFMVTVIGGLTSLGGAVFGAIILESVDYFGEDMVSNLSLLVTGPGLLVVLLLLPGGFAEGFYRLRDRFLRRVARRRDILVPSLLADRRVDLAEQSVVTRAEEQVESAETFGVADSRRLACPVCGMVLSLDEAPSHPHLRATAEVEV